MCQSSRVARSDHICLDSVLDVVRGVSTRHDTFVEGTLTRVAVVTSDTQNDGTLLVHRVVSIGSLAAVMRREPTGLRITASDGPQVARIALDDGCDEARGDGGIVFVLLVVVTGEEAVLEIGHDPRPISGSRAPVGAGAKVDGFHMGVASVEVVGFGVAVVEAAAAECG